MRLEAAKARGGCVLALDGILDDDWKLQESSIFAELEPGDEENTVSETRT